MKPEQGDRNKKQTYEKPRLRIIELVAAEVLAIGCKLKTPTSGPQFPTCFSTGCATLGS
jgi:hypothetical protein